MLLTGSPNALSLGKDTTHNIARCAFTHQLGEFFTQSVVEHGIRKPREAVDAPVLEIFKARLDRL